MDEILARQNRKNQTAIERTLKKILKRSIAHMREIVRRIIEG